MTVWLIEPRDTILVRDGRPFSAEPGVKAATLPFPVPSTTTGVTRTRLGLDAQGVFDSSRLPQILEQQVRGPFLACLDDRGKVVDWLFPAPADALLHDAESEELTVNRLLPLEAGEGCATDFEGGSLLVGSASSHVGKPAAGPAFWYGKHLMKWLTAPVQQMKQSRISLGISGPESETRTHVAIVPDADGASTGTAVEGRLFQTGGLRFVTAGAGGDSLSDTGRLSLAVAVEGSMEKAVKPGIAPFGGERRLVSWRQSSNDLPTLPDGLADRIATDGRLRLLLVTPACFDAGWRPRWLLDKYRLELRAAAVQRFHVLSGWDLHKKAAKPSRRLAAAGSVYFLEFAKDVASSDRNAAVKELWMRPVSDVEQDRRDGFGVCLAGTWSEPVREI